MENTTNASSSSITLDESNPTVTVPTIPKLPLIDSLPPPPPLRTHRGDFQVFGWAFHATDLVVWADANNLGGDNHVQKHTRALKAIAKRLPKTARMARVWSEDEDDRHDTALSYVVGTNRTEQELAWTQDIELVKKFQAVLGWTKPPQWFHYAPANC